MIKRKSNRSGILPRLGTLCLALIISVGAMGVGYAAWIDYVHITGTVTTGDWTEDVGGTIGFWGAWDNHDTFTEIQVEEWLCNIDADSSWLCATCTEDMCEIFDCCSGNDCEARFLGHYLATRLDGESDRLGLNVVHDFSGYDPANYLGLGGSGTLAEIFDAIEAKYGTSPTNSQYNLIKEICDKLNNLLV